jgi:hypothetical protein
MKSAYFKERLAYKANVPVNSCFGITVSRSRHVVIHLLVEVRGRKFQRVLALHGKAHKRRYIVVSGAGLVRTTEVGISRLHN